MNPHLARLQPYPFEKLRRLFAEPSAAGAPAHTATATSLKEIRLSIGEPQHATPAFIQQALADHLHGLASYPSTQGSDALRASIAAWIQRRYGVPAPDPARQVLPVNGSREALFAFAQTIIDSRRPDALVLCPNPFYQIYEGAALLAGATPRFLNTLPENDFEMDFSAVRDEEWSRMQLVYVCTPGNPSGKVMRLASWQTLFELADRHDFVIASDECYSEIYDPSDAAPLGGLEAARRLGRDDYRRLVMFSSLSKRSNVPGLRSGFVAGDATLIEQFLRYRTYHGSAMSPAVQAASIAAWDDEAHVVDNRRLYAAKFTQLTPIIARHLDVRRPDAGFYLWASVQRYGLSDTEFTRRLQHEQQVTVLPGSFLAREADGLNPGAGFIRIALVAGLEECQEAVERLTRFCAVLQ
ncbi:MAG: succinyldiaminopimelate transaminase [Sterolibacterium sp.]|nr:succinyldiaminopimelate transaminase [Sterolibacterium sp.]MBP9800596.1 succinyldiaminopimelate transaminase [Sterolibacterium sp.]